MSIVFAPIVLLLTASTNLVLKIFGINPNEEEEVVSLNETDEVTVWNELIYSSRHTYYPVYHDTLDDIIGILDTKEYFRCQTTSKSELLAQAVNPPYFVPENIKANVLFQNMKRLRIYFAVLVDEYGDFAGIVTLHDLVEALVGDLTESDVSQDRPDIEQQEPGVWHIYGHVSLEQVAKTLHITAPTERYDTFNGYLCELFGRIPYEGGTAGM